MFGTITALKAEGTLDLNIQSLRSKHAAYFLAFNESLAVYRIVSCSKSILRSNWHTNQNAKTALAFVEVRNLENHFLIQTDIAHDIC